MHEYTPDSYLFTYSIFLSDFVFFLTQLLSVLVAAVVASKKKVLDMKMNKATADNDELFMKMRKITASVMMSIDNALHDLVTTLDSEGMLSNTVLFVNSDNGGDTLYAKV